MLITGSIDVSFLASGVAITTEMIIHHLSYGPR